MKALSYPLAFTLPPLYLRKIAELYQFCNSAYICKYLLNLSKTSVPTSLWD
ncbi:hypothetical protein D3C80_1819070 [compost metagenome]